MVLSLLYNSNHLVNFLVNFSSKEPKPVKFSLYEKILFYLSTSYLITFLIYF